jgi:glutamate synthase (NADPH/NADH) small chain
MNGCPVQINIPGFIRHVAAGDFAAAVRALKEQTKLPAICGRVCPQEVQCEAQCILGKKGEPVAIGRLERFVADWEAAQGGIAIAAKAPATGKSIAVIGSGPAGLTAAGDLALQGHRVVIFEALHTPGGVLVYGIPQFRLPKEVVKREVEALQQLGVEIRVNQPIGTAITVPDLISHGFDAIFIGTGAGLPKFMGIPGENLKGVYSANEFLTRVNLMKAWRDDYDTPILPSKATAVIGGGNVAMDAARTAQRLGAEQVFIVYRRTKAEMPARHEEVEHAVEEGIIIKELLNPVAIEANADGQVQGLKCHCQKLTDPDESGRRKPVGIPDAFETLPVDCVIVAIGQNANPLLGRNWPELTMDKHGHIQVDTNGMTSVPGVFAGGDIVTGAATVIEAMGAGKIAARAIGEYLQGK